MPKSKAASQITSDFNQYFDLPNHGLEAYFGRVRSGTDTEFRTSFYEGTPVAQVLERWSPTLETQIEEFPSLLEFENDLRKKVGPLSVMKPLSERLADIDSYYDLIHLDQEPIRTQAISAVLREYAVVRGLQIRGESHTVEVMKKSTNSGSPYFAKRRNVVDKTIPCNLDMDGLDVWQHLPLKSYKACAILGWRGQEGGPSKDDVKQRVVWMFPFAVNVKELQFYQPFIEAVQRFNLNPAWVSLDSVDRRITSLFDTKGPDDYIICTDFAKFDQHFGPACQEAAKSIISSLLNDTVESKDWLSNIFPVKYMIPLAYDLGSIRKGLHGMGSGSGGTNADETVVHRSLQYEAAQYANKTLNPNSCCLGDDGLLSYPGISVDHVLKHYTSHGLEMQSSKQHVSSVDCTFLRRWYHRNYRPDGICRGVYSTYRALGKLMEQERWMDPAIYGPKAIALRELSIIENVRWHPARTDFLKFCLKGSSVGLGMGIPGFLDDIENISRDLMRVDEDFLGYTRSNMSANTGISQWWVVQQLKSMR